MPPVLITADLPGIGGRLKAEPAHFCVEELPLYEPSGTGDHVYVRFSREGWPTPPLLQKLARLFSLRDVDIGCAGLKDKAARAVQTVSLMLPKADPAEVGRRIAEALPVTVEAVSRHVNKLKRGHLRGNRFRIVVTKPLPGAAERAAAVARALADRGCPNFYGHQRFGMRGDNAERGREALRGGGPRGRWERRFVLSALQSALFNRWLEERISRGWFARLLAGDVAKKSDTGGLFTVEDPAVEQPRFDRGEIGFTGPIYGHEMLRARGEPGDLELKILAEGGVTDEELKRARLPGSRRPSRLSTTDLAIAPHPEGLEFTFSLPKGAYATTVMREFIKEEAELPDAGDD